jgi:photosystem II stability/assembly factor-like uncharacterized protein
MHRFSLRMYSFLLLACFLTCCSVLAVAEINPASFSGMRWRSIGPYRGGRVLAVSGVLGQPEVYYFGAVAGGVWKTVNGGMTWMPISDKYPIMSAGAIAVANSDPNVIYVGTGEACIRNDISFGDGVYRSTDGGRHWVNVGLRDTQHIGRIIIDPHDPNIVLVAALGHAYGPNSERGIFRTQDGGKTWQKVLYRDDKTGGTDLAFDPNNSRIVYAAMWQTVRSPWGLTSGGPGSGLFRSTDGGLTWQELKTGLPAGPLGKMSVAVGADSSRVYVLIEAAEGGLFRSNDGGDTWTRVTDDHRFRQRGWYFTHLFADPKNPDTIYILNFSAFRSTDGGKTFSVLPAPHGDHHGLWIDPDNPARMIEGNDGGATISVDEGRTWSTQENQPTAQFYRVITDNNFFYNVYGSQQDNTSVAIASRTEHGAIEPSDWHAVGGGESGYIAPDPAHPEIVYASGYAGGITRWDSRTGQAQMISAWPQFMDGLYAEQVKHRYNWTSPVVISPHDPKVLYHGAEVVFKTTNGGTSWTAISPDLTRNDKSKQQSSGGPIEKDNAGTEYYDTVYAIAESPVQKGLIWVGTDDGLVQLTKDAGANWTNVTPKGLPEWIRVNIIDPSLHNAASAYVATDQHQLDDFHPYIYKTADFGKTWVKITDGLPENAYVHSVREDPMRKGLLFAGTEIGIYVSFDDGAQWQSLQLNLPQVPVYDMQVKNGDLVIATHGRAFYILDDIEPLRQAGAEIEAADVHVFRPRSAYRVRVAGGRTNLGGENGPNGAIVDYYLKAAPSSPVTLQILGSNGAVIRSYSDEAHLPAMRPLPERPGEQSVPRLPAKAGMNRVVWDLRYDPPTGVDGAVYMEGGQLAGPMAFPGSYTVRLKVGEKTYMQPLEVEIDPRVDVKLADLQKQLELGLKIRDEISRTHAAVNNIRALQAQLTSLRDRLRTDSKATAVLASAHEIGAKASAIEEELFQVKKTSGKDSFNYGGRLNDMLIALGASVERADAAPTQGQYEVFEMLSQRTDAQLAAWWNLVTHDVAALNNSVRQLNVAVIDVPVPRTPSGQAQ